MRRLLLIIVLFLAGTAYAAPALSLEWEEAEESLDGRCILALHLKTGLRRFSFRARAVLGSDVRWPCDARETAPGETAAPLRTVPTRVLIHRYNE
ncbi:MAG TPA: hypothetical protein VKM72_26225 [Thermoanaerobaculia bacterium]|nr:hypothetical protein [Thermoanaerobaculia bacterium]